MVHRVARVWPIDTGNGIDTLPADADDVPGEGNLVGQPLGEIGHSWIANYDPDYDYFKD